MSELLTTGQMIDRLKVGEVAVGDVIELGTEIKVFKDKIGHIKLDDSRSLLELSAGIVGLVKWRIIPSYVSFEEAMQALKEGKTVHCHPNWNEKLSYEINPIDAENAALRYLQIKEEGLMGIVFESKWTIEED